MTADGTILIVEDNPLVQGLTRDLLAPEGYDLVCAGDGATALAQASERTPDLILLDVMLPDLSGFEVCRRLRADPHLAEIPILIVTALQDKESRLQGLRAGADDVLSRPVDGDEFLARIRTIMRLNRYRRLSEERQRFEALSRMLLQVQERERRSLATELHDEVGQVLTAVKLSLQSLHEGLATARADKAFGDAMQSVEEALRRVRELSLDLRPAMLDHLGLVPALRWLVDRHNRGNGSQVRLVESLGTERLPAAVEIVCFRLVQEALTNALRHAQAQRVRIWFARHTGGVALTVRDDGVGFEVRAALAAATGGESCGLLGMQERARFAGGFITITSRPARGTRIRAWIPLDPGRAKERWRVWRP